jgi:hypothetical protein
MRDLLNLKFSHYGFNYTVQLAIDMANGKAKGQAITCAFIRNLVAVVNDAIEPLAKLPGIGLKMLLPAVR